MRNLLQDVRYGMRSMIQNPGLSLVIIMTLAIGIGANTAIFSLINTVLFNPLPFDNPEQLIVLRDDQGRNDAPASYPEFRDWEKTVTSFQAIGGYFLSTMSLTGSGEPEEITGMRISAGLLPTLGVTPMFGRNFSREEEESGSDPVVILSHSFWQRRFSSDPSILGKTVTLNRLKFTVIGVLPQSFRGVRPADAGTGPGRDVWTPLRIREAPRSTHFMTVVGRMKPGVSLQQAQSELAGAAGQLIRSGVTRHGISARSLKDFVTTERPLFLVMLTAVGFVLLIACANVANILLARAAARRKEIAVRLALGAARSRVVRQLLTESLLLAIVSGTLGIALALWSVDFLAPAGPGGLPRLKDIGVDLMALAFTLAVSMLSGVLFGIAPAFQACKTDFHETLKESGRHGSASMPGMRVRNTLVIAQIALSLILLIGAGLMIRMFVNMLNVDKGFVSENVLAGFISLPNARYPETHQQARFFQDLLERFSAIPGVRAAGGITELPLTGSDTNGNIVIEGKTFAPDDPGIARKKITTPGYFEALRIPLIRGRFFSLRDSASAPKAAIIDEALAKKYFPGEDPIGRRIDFNWDTDGLQEIVGVVGSIRHGALQEEFFPTIYVPEAQRPSPFMNIVVQVDGDPLSIIQTVRRQVFALDADQPISDVRAFDAIVDTSLAGRKQALRLFGAFAGIALFLAAIGVYGVVSYAVEQRTHEVGIRLALGAQRRDVFSLVVKHGAILTIIGIAIGLAGALALTRLIPAVMVGNHPFDATTYVIVSVLLASIALLACYIPARSAIRVDPTEALRHE